MHVAAVGPQVENGIADDLPRPVIRDVSATPRLVQLDTALRQLCVRGDDVGTARFPDAEGDDARMLEQEEKVRNTPGAALLDERCLHLECVGVGNDAEAPDFHEPRAASSDSRVSS